MGNIIKCLDVEKYSFKINKEIANKVKRTISQIKLDFNLKDCPEAIKDVCPYTVSAYIENDEIVFVAMITTLEEIN